MKLSFPKIQSILHLYELLPDNERVIVDVLRQVVRAHTPIFVKEKISYNVPFFYGNKGICIVWPSFIPRGGIAEGVLLGFWYGNQLTDRDHYLIHGNNKQVFYKIFHCPDQINEHAISQLLHEAVKYDQASKHQKAL